MRIILPAVALTTILVAVVAIAWAGVCMPKPQRQRRFLESHRAVYARVMPPVTVRIQAD